MKIIPFYLPQFHTIPENDHFWGEGFTEWTNVKGAKPMYDGHDQPVEPLDDNYYDLTDVDVLRWQADLAKEYGIYGMCVYHYWIEGRMLLEKPLDNLLANKDVDMKFCISWANHSWTDSWEGTNKTLIAQTYGGEKDWQAHFDYLLPFFLDERYIRDDQDKPMLLIFNPEDISDLNEMIDFWQEKAKENGLKGIAVAYQNYYFGIKKKKDDSRFDYGVEHQPAYAFYDYRGKMTMFIRQYGYKFMSFIQRTFKIKMNMNVTKLEYMDYERLWDCVIKRKPTDSKRIPGAFTGWDNTPRKGDRGNIVKGATPALFEKYMTTQIKRAKEVYNKDMLFVAAWNEWAEGSMMEPDKTNGYGYLEAVRNALKANGELPE